MTTVIQNTPLGERIGVDKLAKVSELLRVTAHPQRLAILDALRHHERMCNRELQQLLGIEQAILSQHLTLMKDRGILACHKEGKFTFWEVRRTELLNVLDCLENCCPNI
ncbi:MAG TPA: metalloregulator ArsR/SmtB family transcription factor [Flavobacteriales bacterium]|nr:metalloregulator ArsR/SmtB family transcription factor [Flavobacteriales bacterium]